MVGGGGPKARVMIDPKPMVVVVAIGERGLILEEERGSEDSDTNKWK